MKRGEARLLRQARGGSGTKAMLGLSALGFDERREAIDNPVDAIHDLGARGLQRGDLGFRFRKFGDGRVPLGREHGKARIEVDGRCFVVLDRRSSRSRLPARGRPLA